MGWIDNLLLKRVVGSITRRIIDLIAGALLAASAPILVSLGQWVQDNNAEIETLIVAAVLALGSLAWSYAQKKTDAKQIKERQVIIKR